jgi:uncharacterized repeat protein (TIGR04076 family)
MKLEIYIDGGSRGNPGPAGAGVVIRNEQETLLQAGYFLGKMTNNQAEYHALLRALTEAATHKPEAVAIYSDSELMVRQLTGQYKVKSAQLRPLYEEAEFKLLGVGDWQIRHVPREENVLADELANAAMDAKGDVVRTGQAKPLAPAKKKRRRRRLLVTIEEGPAPGGCPADMRQGDHFYVSEVMPAMFCTHLAQAVAAVATAMLDAEHDMPEVPVRCRRPGCKALATLSVAPGE